MLKPGHVLSDRYEVVKALGQGGQSNVYLLKDTRLKGKLWVGKEMSVQYNDARAQSLAQKHFEQEANMLATLEHPNLPKVIDYFSQGGKYYLIMEYLEGEDLGALLKRATKPFTEEQVAQWCIQIATVLYYLHRQPNPIIFRDIKPSNIMICQGQVKLIDFGIARHFNPAKKGDTLRIGSPGYSPPEQYSGQTDPRSDIYSLGVTMHQLLTLFDPAKVTTPFQLPPIKAYNPNVSSKMIHIVETCTQIDASKRFQNALDLKRALKEVIGAPMTQLSPPTTLATTAPYISPSATVPVPPPAGVTQQAEYAQPTHFIPKDVVAPTEPAQTSVQVTSKTQPTTPSVGFPISQQVAQSPAPTIGDQKSEPSKPASNSKILRSLALLTIILAIAAIGYFGYSRFDEIKFTLSPKTITPTPTNDAGNALSRGVTFLKEGQYRSAVLELLKARKERPTELETLLYLNKAYAMSSGLPQLVIGIVLPPEDDDKNTSKKSTDFVAGIALAQREANFEGGVGDKNIDIQLCRLTGDKSDEMTIQQLVDSNPLAIIALARGNVISLAEKMIAGKGIPFLYAGDGESSYEVKDSIHWDIPIQRQIDALVQLLLNIKISRVSLVVDSENFDNQRRRLETQLQKNKIIILDSFSYQGGKLEFDTTIEKIRASNSPAIILIGKESSASNFVSKCRKNGLTTKIFVPAFLSTPVFLAQSGEKSNGLVGMSPFFKSPPNYQADYFLDLFRETFSREPDIESAQGYDLFKLVIHAARKSFPEPEKIQAFLTTADTDANFQGISGYFGKNRDSKPIWWGVLESSEGKWKETGGFQY